MYSIHPYLSILTQKHYIISAKNNFYRFLMKKKETAIYESPIWQVLLEKKSVERLKDHTTFQNEHFDDIS